MGATGAALASLVTTAACFTDPPPDLVVTFQPPRIDHTQAQPPEGLVTDPAALDAFDVIIEIQDPTQPCFYSVYDEAEIYLPCAACPPSTSAELDLVKFRLDNTALDPTGCHTIRFSVGSSNSFCRDDVMTWQYQPVSCGVSDAGALGDGAFPEASTDSASIVPETGGGG